MCIVFAQPKCVIYGQDKVYKRDLSREVKEMFSDTAEAVVDTLTQSAKDTINAFISDSLPDLEVLLPDTVYGFANQELNIYWDNFIRFPNTELLWYDVTCSFGAQDERRWYWTPPNDTTGTYDWTVTINNPFVENDEITYSTVLNIINNNVSYTDTLDVLILGDSWTADTTSGYLDSLIDLRDNVDLGLEVMVMHGSLTYTGGSINYEGRSGQTYTWFYSNSASPFTNGGVFDYSNYCSSVISDTPNVVIFQLGINDIANAADATIAGITTTALGYAKAMIDSMKVVLDSTLFGVCMIPPPAGDQDAFGASYNSSRNLWLWEKNRYYFNEQLLAYDFGANVKVVPVVGLDRKYNTIQASREKNARNSDTYTKQVNAVHFAPSGYGQFADILYPFIKNWGIESTGYNPYTDTDITHLWLFGEGETLVVDSLSAWEDQISSISATAGDGYRPQKMADHYSFDGVNDWLDAGDDFKPGDNDFTIMVYCAKDNTGSGDIILSISSGNLNSAGFAFGHGSDGNNVDFKCDAITVIGGTTLTTDESTYYLVGAIRNSDACSLWVNTDYDGVNDTIFANETINAANNMAISSRIAGNSLFYEGNIKGVFLFEGTAKDSTDLANLYAWCVNNL